MDAFDLKALAERLKAKGIPLAEEAAKLLVVEVLGWVEDSVKASSNSLDDLAVPIIESIKPFVLNQIDKLGS